MSQANIDTLFQALAPSADRPANPARIGGNAPAFDNHLSQASATVFDVVRPTNRSDATSAYLNSNRGLPPKDTDLSAGQPTRDREEANTPVCPPAPPQETAKPETSASETEADEDVDDRPDDEAAALAGAAQSTTKDATQKSDATENPSEGNGEEHTNDAVEAKESVKQRATTDAKADKALGNAEVQVNKSNVEVVSAAEPLEVSSETTDEPAIAAESTDENAAATNQAKSGELSVTTTGDVDGQVSSTGEKQSNLEKELVERIGLAPIDTEQVSAQGKGKAVAKSVRSNKSDATESPSNKDTGRDTKETGQANSQAYATVSAAKAAATAVANGIAANIVDVATTGDAAKEVSDKPLKAVAAKTENVVGTLSRVTRAAAEIAGGTQTTDENSGPRVDPARFVGRVAKAFQTASERGGTLQLRLSPPELGAMRIQLTVKDGVMSAALETDNANARRVLLDHLPALRDRLAEQNIRIERFDVDVRQENNSGQANPQGSNQNPYQPQPELSDVRASRVQQRATEPALPDVPAVTQQISSSGINLFV